MCQGTGGSLGSGRRPLALAAHPIPPQPGAGQLGPPGQPHGSFGTYLGMGQGWDSTSACGWESGSGPVRVTKVRHAQDVQAGPRGRGRCTQAEVPMAAPLRYSSGIRVGNEAQQSPSQNSLGMQGWDFSGGVDRCSFDVELSHRGLTGCQELWQQPCATSGIKCGT